MKHKLLLLPLLLLLFHLSHAQYRDGLDLSFGDKGISLTKSRDIYSIYAITNGLLQPDNKIVVLSKRYVARFHSNGTLDISFGDGGLFSYHFSYKGFSLDSIGFTLNGLALQPDGKIIVSGTHDDFQSFVVFRITKDGHIDPSFGTDGIVISPLPWRTWRSVANGLVLQGDGKIIASGYSGGYDSLFKSYDDAPTLLRYLTDGSPDSTFGKNGIVVIPDPKSWLSGAAPPGDVELLPDGRIVQLAGNGSVLRYMPDGSLDLSFNHTGMASVFDDADAPFAYGMAVRSDGKIWISGYWLFDNPTSFILSRLNPDGSTDTGFAPLGYKEYTTDTGKENKCRDLLLLPDGKVILGGWVMNRETKQYNFGIMRITAEGILDTVFGNKGKLLIQLTLSGMHLLNNNLYKLLLQPDGKILGLGEAPNPDYLITSSVPGAWGIVRYEGSGHTGIKELPVLNGFILYPNPASSIFRIENITGLKQVQLMSMEGKVICKWDKPSANAEFSIAELPSGIYIVRLSDENNKQSFIKLTH